MSLKGVVQPVVEKTAKQHDVPITEARVTLKIDDPKATLKEFSASALDDRECFSKTMARIEGDLESMRARGNAWAIGDIATLRTLPQGDQYRTCLDALAATGASLMVTPNTDVAVIRHAVERGLICAAGFSTPSEAFAALSAGAPALKLFPAASFGPGYVRAIRAVLPPQVPVFAVGGVTPDNLPGYLQSGCAGAGLGSDLYAPGQAPSVTRERGGLFVDAYQSARP
ncbi:hypothetical protein AB4084_14690 [Lysobacter sp. 2RAB21]